MTYEITFSIYAKYYPNQPSLLVDWLFYNFKSFTTNVLVSLLKKKRLLANF